MPELKKSAVEVAEEAAARLTEVAPEDDGAPPFEMEFSMGEVPGLVTREAVVERLTNGPTLKAPLTKEQVFPSAFDVEAAFLALKAGQAELHTRAFAQFDEIAAGVAASSVTFLEALNGTVVQRLEELAARNAATEEKLSELSTQVGELIKHVKVIKSGELSRKVTLKGVAATAGAKAAIEAAGGSLAA